MSSADVLSIRLRTLSGTRRSIDRQRIRPTLAPMAHSVNRSSPPPPPNWPEPQSAPPYSAPGPSVDFYPLTLGRTVSLAFSLFRFGWRTFVTISLIAAIPVAVGVSLVTAVTFQALSDWQQSILASVSQPGSTTTTLPVDVVANFPWQGVALSLVTSLVLGVIAFIGGWALTHAIACVITGERLSTRRSYGAAIGRLWHLLALYVVMTILGLGLTLMAVVGPTLILGGPLVLGGGGPLAFLVLVGTVAVVFLSVFLLIRFAFSVQALIIESMSPSVAIRHSYSMVAGSMWRVVGYALAFSAILGLIGIAITIVATIVGLIVSPPTLNALTLTMAPPAVFAQALTLNLLSEVFAPIFSIGMVFLYFDLRWRQGERVPVPGGGEATGRPQTEVR